MDWEALWLSLKLGGVTVLLLIPGMLFAGRWLAYRRFRGRAVVEAMLAVPLVLPPTVVGYYLLVTMGGRSPLGQWCVGNGHATGLPLHWPGPGFSHRQHSFRGSADPAGF